MKKQFLFITSVFICCQLANAQKIELSEVKNEVLKIQTSDDKLSFKDDFNYSLIKYIAEGKEEYYLMGQFDVNEEHSFPPHAKILFKLNDDSLIEIASQISMILNPSKNDYFPTAYYPITEEQLSRLSTGVKKIRIEVLSVDKEGNPFIDYQDLEFKKDKMGQKLHKMHELIIQYETKNKEEITKKINSSSRKPISEDF